MNNTGNFGILEADVNADVPSFVMNGTITVTNLPSEIKARQSASLPKEVNTIGAYMVPAKYLDKYTSELAKRGLAVDSSFTYKDLRGGQKGTGSQQTLLVWITDETNLDEVISALQEITPTLPYS